MANVSLLNISNVDMWNALRAKYPNFRSQTSEATADFFTERGFESMTRDQALTDALNDFYLLSLRVYLQQINVAGARDPLESRGFGETFSNEYGEIAQRIAINSIKPVSPAFRNLVNGQSVDPFVVRKPTSSERFFRTNFDYQSLVTLTDEWNLKNMFLSTDGVSNYMAGIMRGLENGYIKQVYVNKLEAINAGINSTTFPLQSTQIMDVSLSPIPTAEELRAFVLAVRNVITAMTEIGASSSAFNAMGFDTTQELGRLKLLVRPGIINALAVNLLSNTFNMDQLQLGVDFITVENFGGLIPFTDDTFTTRLYEVYDAMGTMIGFDTTEGSTTVTVPEGDAVYQDPNEDTVALLADTGIIFNTINNPYRVEPIRNPRGLYTNYWASSPNNAINYDHLMNIVTFNNVA